MPPLPRRARAVAPVLAAALLLTLGACRRADEPRVSRAEIEAFGITGAAGVAPPIELTAMDGSRFSLAEARGQVVFVNFWATWCPPCREEMPSMLALGRELEARNPGKFRMVAVTVDDGWDPVREFFAAPPYAGAAQGATVVLDEEQQVTVAYYCAARGGCPTSFKFPETYIVDKSGRLVAYVVGPRDWSAPAARAWLEGLIRS